MLDLDPEHAYIQITHVEPYFTPEDLEKRKTKFEMANNISRFVFETPFTKDGKSRGDVTKQCMRKTILTSELRMFMDGGEGVSKTNRWFDVFSRPHSEPLVPVH